ncbi:UNVERIFIED_CONTAM: Retrovirus-related Pol polyprotein from transposon TNT 1-94 [Sesamum latifolium]|uniref:Retrovirus-related Pol polyprotein from transposon TNT 1-94 n=1 Tax=Sesamum latifolium TaxID=2727402 RepID=A0AAW2VED2_9LAMI
MEKVKVILEDVDEDTNEQEHMQEAKVDIEGELEIIPTMKKKANHHKEAVENRGEKDEVTFNDQMKEGMTNLMWNATSVIDLVIFAWECQDETKDVKGKANLVNNNQEIEESTLLLTIKEEEKDNNSLWYLDNGASNHMCGQKDQFVKLDEKVRGNIFFGDSSNIHIEGKGTILISTKDGNHKLISDVYYVPKLESNILSLGQFLENGYKVLMKDNCLWWRDRNTKLLAKVVMSKNRMLKLNIKTVEAKCLKVHVQDVAWQWHKRYGHLNFGALRKTGEKKMVYEIPSINHSNHLCEACLVGKHTRKSFPKETAWRATKPFELVDKDVCGPINPSSLGKSKYFILFIDDFSRKTWIYFLKQKSEAFATFKKFKSLVEKESGYEIKALRSDRGGEFTSKEFNHFCAINGIHRPMTILGTPQQNSMAERKNRTILNMARSMLKEKYMPKEFWAEAVSCAVYLSNRSPTLNVRNQTPQEAWNGRKPKCQSFASLWKHWLCSCPTSRTIKA